MKNRIITNSIRSIKKSISRFIPLVVMSFLGAFVFAGLQSTKLDMLTTLDNFLDGHNTYDIKIISTGGLTKDDINELNKIKDIDNVEFSYSIDKVIKNLESDIVINISSIPKNINTISLIKGKMPEKNNEIVVEKNFIEKTSYKLGDVLSIDDEKLKVKEYIIVGIVESSLYINNDKTEQNRGTTTIGSGIINYYSYILEESFEQDYYNYIYITITDAIDKVTSDEDYISLVDNITNKINKIKLVQENKRYNYLYNQIKDEIEKLETKANKELSKAYNKLEDAKYTLKNSKKQLDLLKSNLDTYKINLDSAKNKLENAKNEYKNVLIKNNIEETDIETQIIVLNENISKLENMSQFLELDSIEYFTNQNNINELNVNLEKLITLDNTKDIITESENEYDKNLLNYNSLYRTYKTGLEEYSKALKEYDKGVNEYNNKKLEAESKINDAKKELEKLEKPIWYIYDRTNYGKYANYIDDITSINNLSKIFPIVFFAVAILVCLMSMNRMVEEERIEIGTLKSLGFSNKEIMIKYLLFSSTATIFGGLLGSVMGVLFIPIVISSIYSLLYNVPNFYVGLNLSKIIISLIVSLICICGTTIYTIFKVVKEKPSNLMRPKAPKMGKKIFLEKCNFLWKNISFSNKVTIRNLYRYKKRGFVTIIGIAGCTALMLCGFGVRDAVKDISYMQYKETFIYDAMVYIKDNNINIDEIFNSKYISNITSIQNINVKKDNVSANLFVISKEDLSSVVNLVDKNNNKLKLQKGEVIITDKFADLINVKIGDTIEVIDDNNHSYSYKIGGIAKNYLMHYIYIDKETYMEKNKYNSNVVYLDFKNITEKQKSQLKDELLKKDEIINISYIKEILDGSNNMLKSLNKVILIIILLAASLSFVVLYNLSNININERKREISTLKVLGFHDSEVDNYITKENIIFTLFGIILGLFFGYFFTRIVIITVEIEKAKFIHNISINSYIISASITIVFTLINNFITHFNLKKIDMIASLKSVD